MRYITSNFNSNAKIGKKNVCVWNWSDVTHTVYRLQFSYTLQVIILVFLTV